MRCRTPSKMASSDEEGLPSQGRADDLSVDRRWTPCYSPRVRYKRGANGRIGSRNRNSPYAPHEAFVPASNGADGILNIQLGDKRSRYFWIYWLLLGIHNHAFDLADCGSSLGSITIRNMDKSFEHCPMPSR